MVIADQVPLEPTSTSKKMSSQHHHHHYNHYQFLFHLFTLKSEVNKLRGRVQEWLQPYLGQSGPFYIDYSLQPVEFRLEPDPRFDFDAHYLGNVNNSTRDWVKMALVYKIQPVDHRGACLDASQRRKHELQFATVQARIRRHFYEVSRVRAINDNFLNFRSSRFDPVESYRRLNSLAQTNAMVRELIRVIEEHVIKVTDRCKVCLSFNGGKDCTLLLHIMVTLSRHHHPSENPLPLLMIETCGGPQFPEQDLYVRRASTYYGTRLLTYQGVDIKAALAEVHRQQPFRTIVMGVRRSDLKEPYRARLSVVQPTDAGWPEFIRIQPLLDWTYAHIWSTLLHLDVPYCTLYDHGYTSLDLPSNTIRNRALMVAEPGRTEVEDDPNALYLPAYLLDQDSMERCCRVTRKNKV